MRLPLAVACVALSAMSVAAQDIRTLDPGAAPATATISDFAGLTGTWAAPGAVAGFSPPTAGQIVGYVVLYRDGQPVLLEMEVFREEDGSVVMLQKHYGGDLTDREEPDQWSRRRLVAVEPGRVFLENQTWTAAGDTLRVDVRTGAGLVNYVFQRVK